MGLLDHSKSQSCEDQDSGCLPPAASVGPLARPYSPPPPPPASHGPRTFVTALIIAGSVLAFLAVCLSVFLFVRRRRLRLRREALLEAALAPAAPGAFPGDGDGDQEGAVHHVWHIRTVGLDAAAIESIAPTPYRAGGALGASDCTVCLGEFQDGELLRLLPKCGHAFHVHCIDTWLRAHVNCPLCRADVVDRAAEQPAVVVPPPGAADADASAQQFASSRSVEPEQRADELQDLRVQILQTDDHSSSPEERPRRHPGARAQNFRRVASMDSPLPTVSSAEESLPEHDQADGEEKQGTGGAVCGVERSLSAGSRWRWTSRHARARSSLLPL
ncbi:hypothetical protein U9M48_023047 [Paspalum notatum var. saurae]|uniref:RING-type E3 ubiquitin transferase n=1 Tax=Paspalum notatum var. saurae TaxID=547442 RepID=A0AAQ3TJI5_PASNO